MHSGDGALLPRSLAAQLGGELIETHISWVILSGDEAYKIKKPVQLPFVNYSTLAARQHFCNEELRLNRRLAPSLYLEVLPITGSAGRPVLGGSGPALDYAVHMRRFSTGSLFVARLAAGELRPADVDDLSALLAGFHRSAPRADPSTRFDSPALRRKL